MIRDMNLIREILFEIENDTLTSFVQKQNLIKYPDIEFQKLYNHILLLKDDKYIETDEVISHMEFTLFRRIRMTNKGHDFLDSIRDKSIWEKTMDKVIKIGGCTLPIIQKIASKYIEEQI